MKVKILGSGTVIPVQPVRNCSGYLIDKHLLLDCGPGTWRALAEANISLTDLNHILISHFHTDHVGDLPALLLQRYLLKEKIILPLTIGGPARLPEWFAGIKDFCGSWFNTRTIRFVALPDTNREFCDFLVSAAPTDHTAESLCFRIENRAGKVVFYSGDSGYHNNLISMAEEADVAILEASMTEETKVEGHLTPGLAAKIGRKAGVKRLILTHLYPHVYQTDIEGEVKKEFSGEFSLADDGMEIEI
jgi:ribonuclease BN (tRNA processing enzyme)